jgi:hypothetical protein
MAAVGSQFCSDAEVQNEVLALCRQPTELGQGPDLLDEASSRYLNDLDECFPMDGALGEVGGQVSSRAPRVAG